MSKKSVLTLHIMISPRRIALRAARIYELPQAMKATEPIIAQSLQSVLCRPWEPHRPCGLHVSSHQYVRILQIALYDLCYCWFSGFHGLGRFVELYRCTSRCASRRSVVLALLTFCSFICDAIYVIKSRTPLRFGGLWALRPRSAVMVYCDASIQFDHVTFCRFQIHTRCHSFICRHDRITHSSARFLIG